MVARRWRIAGLGLVVLAIVIAALAVLVVPDEFPNQPISIRASKVTPQLQTSYYSAFLLAPDGSLWTWGESASFVTTPTSVPQQVGRGTDWKRIAHRFSLAAALRADGSLWTCHMLTQPNRRMRRR